MAIRTPEYTVEWDSRPALLVEPSVLGLLQAALAEEAPQLLDPVLHYDSDTGVVGGVCQIEAIDASHAARQATTLIDSIFPTPTEALTIYRIGDDN